MEIHETDKIHCGRHVRSLFDHGIMYSYGMKPSDLCSPWAVSAEANMVELMSIVVRYFLFLDLTD
jgi:hypothetical protein